MPRQQDAKIVIVTTTQGLRANFVGKGFMDKSANGFLGTFSPSQEARIVEHIPVDVGGDEHNAEMFSSLNKFTLAVGADAISDTLEALILRVYQAGLNARK